MVKSKQKREKRNKNQRENCQKKTEKKMIRREEKIGKELENGQGRRSICQKRGDNIFSFMEIGEVFLGKYALIVSNSEGRINYWRCARNQRMAQYLPSYYSPSPGPTSAPLSTTTVYYTIFGLNKSRFNGFRPLIFSLIIQIIKFT